MSLFQEFRKGIFEQNPTFGLMLGLCPTLATTTSLKNGLAMGLAASSVLICSNAIISLIRKWIPDQIRIPCYIVVIASFVTMVELFMKAFAPDAINQALGIFIPLIVVNCIILGRAEAFASKNNLIASIIDGVGMGLGFTLALSLISSIRELLGAGTVWGMKVSMHYTPVSVMIMAPGAFLLMGLLLGFFNWMSARRAASRA